MIASKDKRQVVLALQLAFTLLEKLPRIFQAYFRREGVAHALRRLAEDEVSQELQHLLNSSQCESPANVRVVHCKKLVNVRLFIHAVTMFCRLHRQCVRSDMLRHQTPPLSRLPREHCVPTASPSDPNPNPDPPPNPSPSHNARLPPVRLLAPALPHHHCKKYTVTALASARFKASSGISQIEILDLTGSLES